MSLKVGAGNAVLSHGFLSPRTEITGVGIRQKRLR